jgi:hypothetical protein
MTTISKPPSTEQTAADGQIPSPCGESSPLAAPNDSPAKSEVTYASGESSKLLPGLSLIGKPEIKTRRTSPKAVRTQEHISKSPGPGLTPPSAKLLGAVPLMSTASYAPIIAGGVKSTGFRSVTPVVNQAPTVVAAGILPVKPTANSAPATANSTVPSIFRGTVASNRCGERSKSVLNGVARQIFNLAMEK